MTTNEAARPTLADRLVEILYVTHWVCFGFAATSALGLGLIGLANNEQSQGFAITAMISALSAALFIVTGPASVGHTAPREN